MAYTTLYIGPRVVTDDEGRYMEFIMDAPADAADLPTTGEGGENAKGPRPGSMAVCAADAALYMLNNSRQWNVLVGGVS